MKNADFARATEADLMVCPFCAHCRGSSTRKRFTSPVQVARAALIVADVEREYNLRPRRLISTRRARREAWPRQLAMYFMREVARMSYPQIGEYMKRDHSTVIYACRAVTKRIGERPLFAGEVAKMRERMTQESARGGQDELSN